MGGKSVPGKTLLLKAALDRKGVPIGPDAVSPKYNTPKCEFILQLVWVEDDDSFSTNSSSGVWVGAHPSLGERLAEAMLKGGHLNEVFAEGPVISYEREVTGIAGDNSRADFVLSHGKKEGGTDCRSVLEVKTVVDTDIAAAHVPREEEEASPNEESSPKKRKSPTKASAAKKASIGPFVSHELPYVRHALFPWGGGAQKGPDGEKVVSARAVKHINELAALKRGERLANAKDASDTEGRKDREDQSNDEAGDFKQDELLGAHVLFVVNRADALAFRPNHEACPSFANHLKAAQSDGVGVYAHRVTWGQGCDEGKAFYSGEVPVSWNLIPIPERTA